MQTKTESRDVYVHITVGSIATLRKREHNRLKECFIFVKWTEFMKIGVKYKQFGIITKEQQYAA